MAKLTRKAIWDYANALQKISRKARDDFLTAVNRVDLTAENASEQLKQIGRVLLNKYGVGAKELAAQWYDYCRQFEIEGGYTAFIGDVSRYPIESDMDALANKFAAGELSDADYIARLGGIVAGQIHREAKNTILGNLEFEYSNGTKVRTSSGYKRKKDVIGFCRVPEPGACAFCVLLASQAFYGYKYFSEQGAGKGKGFEYHNDCKCSIVPFVDAQNIEGYQDELAGYVDSYETANNMRNGDLPEDLQERIDKAREEHEANYALYLDGKRDSPTEPWRSVNENLIIMRWNNPALH